MAKSDGSVNNINTIFFRTRIHENFKDVPAKSEIENNYIEINSPEKSTNQKRTFKTLETWKNKQENVVIDLCDDSK